MDNKIKPGFGDEITLPEWTTLSIRNKELYETAIAEGGNPAHLNKKNLAEAYLADKFIQNQKDAKGNFSNLTVSEWEPVLVPVRSGPVRSGPVCMDSFS